MARSGRADLIPMPGIASANVTASADAFTTALYQSTTGLHTTGNFMVSPISIMYATVMLYLGARGKTKSEIYIASRFNRSFENENADISGAFGTLMQQYQSKSGGNAKPGAPALELSLANGVFVVPSAKVDPVYLSKVTKDLQAAITNVDIATNPTGARLQINKWVEDKTNGKVKDLIADGQISSSTKSVLVNAVYFKSTWAQPFDIADTADASFTKLDGTTATVKMMRVQGSYRYTGDSGLKVEFINIPYLNGEASMLILLPFPTLKFRDFEKAFNTSYFDIMENKAKREMTTVVRIPKFKMEVSSDLKKLMQDLGVKDAFDSGKADLSGMLTGESLYVSSAFHKTFIEVDEKGTVAAGASGSAQDSRSGPRQFEADRPFVFAIRHNPTKTILFIGRFEQP